MFTSSGSTGGRGRGRGGVDAKTILSPNTSFGDIISIIYLSDVFDIWQHGLLCGGYTESPRNLRVIYKQKLIKITFHQELVGKIFKFLLCYLTEGRNLLMNTRNNSRGLAITRHKFPDRMERFKTVGKLFPSGWLVCWLQVPHKLVVCYSRTHMSLGTDVSQSQVTLEISPEWQFLPSDLGGT